MSIYLGNTEIQKIYIGSTEVPKAYLGTVEVYGTGPQPIDYSKEYFTISAIEPGTITWAPTGTTEYSVNKGAWDTWNGSLAVNAGDKVRFRSAGNTYNSTSIKGTGNYEVEGNIMSLLYGDNFENQLTITTQAVFSRLFAGDNQFAKNTTLLNAENLVLPATTLTQRCYSQMFQYCVNLTKAPKELPAPRAVYYAYEYMFKLCDKLTTPPIISASIADSYSMQYMFDSCKSMIVAPELPATLLGEKCYDFIFQNCTSLTTGPSVLPATTLNRYCYRGMFYKDIALTTPPVISATEIDYYSLQNMFGGCTSLTTAPELPAANLKNYCYGGLFSGCTSLNYIKCLAQTNTTGLPVGNWTDGVSPTGTFVKKAGITWDAGVSGIPVGWNVIEE